MTSPTAALTWEIWRRHGKRLVAAVAVLVAFVLFYPKSSSFFGVDLHAPNALDQLAMSFSSQVEHIWTIARVFDVLMIVGLLLGPLACMLVTLLYLIGVFTFVELGPRKEFVFPARLFRLPISTQ